MRFRPCIDIHNGKVKQIVGGTLSDSHADGLVTNFETNLPPAHFASLYKKENLRGGHVIMLGPGNAEAAIDALSAWPGGMHAGGGITPANAKRFLDAGASHVIVTSYVFRDGAIRWERLDELSGTVPKERLVLDLSCRAVGDDYIIVADRWQTLTKEKLSGRLLARLSAYCDEFLVHATDMEGLRRGVDQNLVRLLADASPIPAVYAGGVRNLGDMDTIDRICGGRIDATVGSGLDLFGGPLPFAEIVAWNAGRNR
jgi:phosphoribosylformimino-5-aminoimidazole carboxamide ribotide isomerase